MSAAFSPARTIITRIFTMLTRSSLNSTLDRMLTLNRVLDEALASTWNGNTEGRSWIPALDVVERADAYLIALEVPGVDPANIDVSFEQNVLTVRGSKPMGFGLGRSEERRVGEGGGCGGWRQTDER